MLLSTIILGVRLEVSMSFSFVKNYASPIHLDLLLPNVVNSFIYV